VKPHIRTEIVITYCLGREDFESDRSSCSLLGNILPQILCQHPCICLLADCSLGLFLDPERSCESFLRNVGRFIQNYTACRDQENLHLHIHSYIRLHGIALNSLSTGTTLPFYFLLHGDTTQKIVNIICTCVRVSYPNTQCSICRISQVRWLRNILVYVEEGIGYWGLRRTSGNVIDEYGVSVE
jgi:hypothetical protein